MLVSEFYTLNTPPKFAESIATAIWTVKIRQNRVSRRISQTDHSGVEPNIDVACMAAWLEHQGVSTVTPLTMVAVAAHLVPDLINTALAV